jgi:hypothetical protein
MDTSRCPSLTYGQVNAIDLNELGGYISNLTSSQLLTPDNNLEEYLREIAGLPGFRAEANGTAENSRYADSTAPDQIMTDDNKPFVADASNGKAAVNGDTRAPATAATGGPNDQSGGSGIQADITSAGYTGEAPPSSKGPTKNTTGQNGPLTNNQGSTT